MASTLPRSSFLPVVIYVSPKNVTSFSAVGREISSDIYTLIGIMLMSVHVSTLIPRLMSHSLFLSKVCGNMTIMIFLFISASHGSLVKFGAYFDLACLVCIVRLPLVLWFQLACFVFAACSVLLGMPLQNILSFYICCMSSVVQGMYSCIGCIFLLSLWLAALLACKLAFWLIWLCQK